MKSANERQQIRHADATDAAAAALNRIDNKNEIKIPTTCQNSS